MGVTGYDILRAAGTSGGSFATVGTATGNELHRERAQREHQLPLPGPSARDAAGNTSAVSNTSSR